MQEQYWTTKDGRKIAVGDMTLEHLRNVLRMLLRQNIQSNKDMEVNSQSYLDPYSHDKFQPDYVDHLMMKGYE